MISSLSAPRRLRFAFPAVLTLASMFCGYISLTSTFSGSFRLAAWLIAVGGVFDALDGPVARMLGAQSKFGAELDSFADAVTFGIAPAFLFYRSYFSHWGVVGLLLGFMPIVATVIRLSRYNLSAGGTDRDYFRGFTSTANGFLLASFVLFSHELSKLPAFSAVAAALVVLSSILMVSGVPYMTISKFTAGGVWRTPQGRLWMPVALVVVLFPAKAFFPAMLTVMFQGPLGPRIEHALHHLPGIRR